MEQKARDSALYLWIVRRLQDFQVAACNRSGACWESHQHGSVSEAGKVGEIAQEMYRERVLPLRCPGAQFSRYQIGR